VRNDGVVGPDVVGECAAVVAVEPAVKSVTVHQNESGSLECRGESFGGAEGASFVV
jgi:hypothetical protein